MNAPQEMNDRREIPLTVTSRRRAMRLAYWNGALWATGNGLASTTLVVYLAMEFDSARLGLSIGLILAMPNLVGLLRLAAPAMIGRLVDRKVFCMAAYLLSAIVLAGLPIIAAPGLLPSDTASLVALVVCWSVYHLLEYAGTVALWSWLGDLVPRRIRGRFIGVRQCFMIGGGICAMIAAGRFAWWWKDTLPEPVWWMAYAIPAVVGAGFMGLALVPLAMMPRVAAGKIVREGAGFRSMTAPFRDSRFLGLLVFGCWFSYFNGVTQSAQYSYPKQVLGFGLLAILLMRIGMRLGQVAVSPTMGRLADRWGNRSVMACCLALVAAGPLFFYLATPERRWLLIGAWVTWIAYAGLNVCLPNIMLKFSPHNSNTSYIAAYFALTGLCYALSTIAGGAIYDRYAETLGPVYYDYCFIFGWVTRSLGVLVLLAVIRRGD